MPKFMKNPYVQRMNVKVTARSEGIQIQVVNLAGEIAIKFLSWDSFFTPTKSIQDKEDIQVVEEEVEDE